MGIQAIITLISYLFFILLAFWCIQAIPFHKFMGRFESQAKMLIVLLSIALGYTVASFFLRFDYGNSELNFFSALEG